MEQRDVTPPVDIAQEQQEPIARPGPAIEPRWLDVDTAAQYLCMTRHALYHQVGARAAAVRPSRSSPEIRSRGARPLVGEGGEVWLW